MQGTWVSPSRDDECIDNKLVMKEMMFLCFFFISLFSLFSF